MQLITPGIETISPTGLACFSWFAGSVRQEQEIGGQDSVHIFMLPPVREQIARPTPKNQSVQSIAARDDSRPTFRDPFVRSGLDIRNPRAGESRGAREFPEFFGRAFRNRFRPCKSQTR